MRCCGVVKVRWGGVVWVMVWICEVEVVDEEMFDGEGDCE